MSEGFTVQQQTEARALTQGEDWIALDGKVVYAHDALLRALDALDRVRALHREGSARIVGFNSPPIRRQICLHCSQLNDGETVSVEYTRLRGWPCADIRAIEGTPE